MYIRIPRSNVINVFDETYNFDIGKAVTVEEGNDAVIFTNGETLAESIIAAQKLKHENISIRVVNVPVIKPLDESTIIEASKDAKFVITVENHSIIGGLGTAICETLSLACPKKVFRIGINDEFGQSGEAKELMIHYGLDSESLAKKIRTIYHKEVNNND